MADYDLLLINPSVVTKRPTIANVGNIFTPKNVVCRSFNTGLLSIASVTDKAGFQVKIIDLLEEETTKILRKELEIEKPLVAGISCYSGFGYPSARESAELVKQLSPSTIVIGGGCHLGPLGAKVFEDTNGFDMIEQFEGEWVIQELLKKIKEHDNPFKLPGLVYKKDNQILVNAELPPPVDLNQLPNLRFDIYPDYKRFVPYIEESRGCFAECGFCMSSFQYQRKIRLKKPEKIRQEFDHLFGFFGNAETYAVLAATFGVNAPYAIEFSHILKKYNIRWTTETRVDTPWKKWISEAVNSGMTVLNASPESGSPEVLLRMKKTLSPDTYLKNADELIDSCYNQKGPILKLNYLFYLGENPNTIHETLDFIFKRREKIHSLACSPLMIYPGSEAAINFQYYEKGFGASMISDDFWNSLQIFPCNISKHFSFMEMSTLSSVLDKIFNTEEEYYQTMEYKFGTKKKDMIKEAITEAKFGGQGQ
jgi:radical SAM superfamily enzyme YgiQ (UPF0313 family)